MWGGPSVPLLAGASAYNNSTIGGAFSFHVPTPPSGTYWNPGSAFIYIMLFAGAGAPHASLGGSLTFDVRISPSEARWDYGSAPCWWKCWR